MIRTKSLQSFVNIRHFKNASWDEVISSPYKPLFDMAYCDIQFWFENANKFNFRSFILPKPTLIAWTDASDFAVAAFVIILHTELVPNAITADNLLIDRSNYSSILNHRAIMQVDTLPHWTNGGNIVRDAYDLDPHSVKWHYVIHRNLTVFERTLSSTERELLAILYMVTSILPHLRSKTITVHSDSQNAVTILQQGSNKAYLNKYARLVSDIAIHNDIKINCVWIPRTLNNVADTVSEIFDFDDFMINLEFYRDICTDFSVKPTFDRFANAENKKVEFFNSLYYCSGTSGVDAFNYDWSLTELNWLFPPIRRVLKALSYLRICKAKALFLIPQWKFSAFYTAFQNIPTKYVRSTRVYNARNKITSGSDSTSFFGPEYDGNIEVWYISFA